MRPLKQLSLLALLLSFVLAGCSTSKEVTTGGLFEKRKYRKGWHLNMSGSADAERAAQQRPARTPKSTDTEAADADLIVYEPVAEAEQNTSAPTLTPVDVVPVTTGKKRPALEWTKPRKPQALAPASPEVPQGRVDAPRPDAVAQEGGKPATNTWAIVGFICAFFVPILGIIFSIIALNKIKKTGERGRGLAIAGIIISIVTILIIVASAS